MLPSGMDGSGYRTIMAYRLAGHGRKINYWSAADPSVKFRGQYATGDAEADNKRLLTETRFVFAAIGDESEACSSAVTAGTTPATTTTGPKGTGGGSDWAFCSKGLSSNIIVSEKKELSSQVPIPRIQSS